MAASIGRKVVLTWGGMAIPGVREKGISVNGEPIDITSDDDNGWRTLLEEAGERSVDISVSGVTKSQIFLTDMFAGTVQKPVTLTYPNGAILAGTFHLASTSDTAPYKDAQTFEGTLQSTGVVTFTPAP
ncbi:MAG TPA: phage tail tube protein [Kaistia sp.]|nr:phage tail tube protein [Kaistia sp.]